MEMANLPADIFTDILARLPVKSLLRFRCVSKLWCALIDGRDFVRLHLNTSVESNSNLFLIVKEELHNELSSVDMDSLERAVVLNHPLQCSRSTNVLGSCNGLLLLGNTEKGIAICNPSTRRYWRLPDSSISSPDYPRYLRSIIYGFGYDSITDDYKVIRIVQFFCEEYNVFSSEVKVYALKSNSWRRIKDFPYYLCFRLKSDGVLAGGALHWVVKEKREPDMPTLVVAFDIGLEEYQLVPQPEYFKGCYHMDVEVFAGCLCITCSYYKDRIDVWVMKEYGAKESWTKLLSVLPPAIRTFEYMKPLVYSKSGTEILFDFDDKKLFWYDLKGEMVQEVKVSGMPFSFDVKACMGSLVPPDGNGRLEGEKGKDKMNRKKRDDFLSEGFKLVL